MQLFVKMRCPKTHMHTTKKLTQSFWEIKTLRWGLFGLPCEEKQRKEERNQTAEIKHCEKKSSAWVQKADHNNTRALWKFNLRLYPVISNGHLFLPLYNQKTTSTSDTEHENIKGFYSFSVWLWHLVALKALHKTISHYPLAPCTIKRSCQTLIYIQQ